MKDLIEILELVYELNDATVEQTGETGKLLFESTGFVSRVTLCGEVVWDDDDNKAPWNDDGSEQMPIRSWFQQRIHEITCEQTKMAGLMLASLGVVADTRKIN